MGWLNHRRGRNDIRKGGGKGKVENVLPKYYREGRNVIRKGYEKGTERTKKKKRG